MREHDVPHKYTHSTGRFFVEPRQTTIDFSNNILTLCIIFLGHPVQLHVRNETYTEAFIQSGIHIDSDCS